MKKLLQLVLLILLFLIAIVFYQLYIKSKKIVKINQNQEEIILKENQNNLIKNLKYEIKFSDNSKYIITSDLSEMTYVDEIEIVKMKKVLAKFIEADNTELIINSKNATYNNDSFNTNFYNEVIISYLDNEIKSENMDVNFEENIVSIYNHVVYEGQNGVIKTDNLLLDLVTKDIQIFMNNEKHKVEITSN